MLNGFLELLREKKSLELVRKMHTSYEGWWFNPMSHSLVSVLHFACRGWLIVISKSHAASFR